MKPVPVKQPQSADAARGAIRRSATPRRERDRAHLRLLECERRQAAQYIHDDLGGILTALKANLDIALAGAATGALDTRRRALFIDAAGLAATAFESLRKVGLDLRPTLLEQLGLTEAVESLLDGVARRTGMQTSFRYDARVFTAEWLGEAERVIFRVVSEAIVNAEKHSFASRVDVRLFEQADFIVACVEDDGVGPAPGALGGAGTLGIIGIREQVAEIGGSLVCAPSGSHAHPGLCVCMHLPARSCRVP